MRYNQNFVDRLYEKKFKEKTRRSNNFLKEFYAISNDKKHLLMNSNSFIKDKILRFEEWSQKIYDPEYCNKTIEKPKKGEIWTIDFGVNIGSEIEKVRPCIIVSYDNFNDKSDLCTVIPITRKDSEKIYNTHFSIDSSSLYYSDTSLYGVAKAEQITTKSQFRLGRKIGQLNEKGQSFLNKSILNHLDIH